MGLLLYPVTHFLEPAYLECMREGKPSEMLGGRDLSLVYVIKHNERNNLNKKSRWCVKVHHHMIRNLAASKIDIVVVDADQEDSHRGSGMYWMGTDVIRENVQRWYHWVNETVECCGDLRASDKTPFEALRHDCKGWSPRHQSCTWTMTSKIGRASCHGSD